MSQDTKPAGEAKEEVISIKIKSIDGDEVTFKVKPTTKFKKIFDAYAKRKAINVEAGKFLLDGEIIRDIQTPQDVGIEDGDVSCGECFRE
jgi:Ubiquitin-2 like Rad60 SUMO-like